jgi:hypothetical protein
MTVKFEGDPWRIEQHMGIAPYPHREQSSAAETDKSDESDESDELSVQAVTPTKPESAPEVAPAPG